MFSKTNYQRDWILKGQSVKRILKVSIQFHLPYSNKKFSFTYNTYSSFQVGFRVLGL